MFESLGDEQESFAMVVSGKCVPYINGTSPPPPHFVNDLPFIVSKNLDSLHFNSPPFQCPSREKSRGGSCLHRCPTNRQRVALSCVPLPHPQHKLRCCFPLSNWALSGAGSCLISCLLAVDDSAPSLCVGGGTWEL